MVPDRSGASEEGRQMSVYPWKQSFHYKHLHLGQGVDFTFGKAQSKRSLSAYNV